MIPEVGHLALVIALVMSVLLTAVPLWGSWRGHYGAMRLAPTLAAAGQDGLLLGASLEGAKYSRINR